MLLDTMREFEDRNEDGSLGEHVERVVFDQAMNNVYEHFNSYCPLIKDVAFNAYLTQRHVDELYDESLSHDCEILTHDERIVDLIEIAEEHASVINKLLIDMTQYMEDQIHQSNMQTVVMETQLKDKGTIDKLCHQVAMLEAKLLQREMDDENSRKHKG